MQYIFTILMMLILAATSAADPRRDAETLEFQDWLGGKYRPSFQLLDPSKLTIQHSLSMGAAFGSGSSLMHSLYMTRIGYQLSNPLTLTFILGLQDNRWGGAASNMSQTFPFGGFSLDYRPSEDLHFRLSLMQSPLLWGWDRKYSQPAPFPLEE